MTKLKRSERLDLLSSKNINEFGLTHKIVNEGEISFPKGNKLYLDLENPKGLICRFVLNATNEDILGDMGFSDTDELIEKSIVLKTVDTMYMGKPTIGIRIESVK